MVRRLTIERGRQNTGPTKSTLQPVYSIKDSHMERVPREVRIIASLIIFNSIEPLVRTRYREQ